MEQAFSGSFHSPSLSRPFRKSLKDGSFPERAGSFGLGQDDRVERDFGRGCTYVKNGLTKRLLPLARNFVSANSSAWARPGTAASGDPGTDRRRNADTALSKGDRPSQPFPRNRTTSKVYRACRP